MMVSPKRSAARFEIEKADDSEEVSARFTAAQDETVPGDYGWCVLTPDDDLVAVGMTEEWAVKVAAALNNAEQAERIVGLLAQFKQLLA